MPKILSAPAIATTHVNAQPRANEQQQHDGCVAKRREARDRSLRGGRPADDADRVANGVHRRTSRRRANRRGLRRHERRIDQEQRDRHADDRAVVARRRAAGRRSPQGVQHLDDRRERQQPSDARRGNSARRRATRAPAAASPSVTTARLVTAGRRPAARSVPITALFSGRRHPPKTGSPVTNFVGGVGACTPVSDAPAGKPQKRHFRLPGRWQAL